MLGCAKSQRSPAVGGEHIDVAAAVQAVGVGLPPRALRNVDHAGQDARGQAGGDDQLAPVVPDTRQVSVTDAPGGRVEGLMNIRWGKASCSQSLLACVEWTRARL